MRKTREMKMKKLVIMMGAIAVAFVTNAASFKWQAAQIYGANGTSTYSGDVTLYCTQVSGWSQTVQAAAGAVKAADTEFASDSFSAGNYYDFYFVIEDGGSAFTSGSVQVAAQKSDVVTINFGTQKTATQNASNWAPVPEPTSALLMVLGVAGLALRRRRV